MKKSLILILPLALFISCQPKISADYLIQNATIFDGLGNPGYEADLIIWEGKMKVVVEGERVDASHVIDASGLSLAPGFIDVHNHSDQGINHPDRKLNEGFIRQGVTTIVGGPDGRQSPSGLQELIDAYEQNGIGTNVAFYVGHNGIRREVMQDDQQRPPTSAELEAMKTLVREGMEMGAIGLSTGLMYEPGMYSETDEVIALASEVAPFNGIYDSHVRNPVHEFIKSDQEVIEIATQSKIPGKLGHLKAVGLHNDGAILEIIEMVERARAKGVEIISDQYPYDGAATSSLEGVIIIPSEWRERKVLDSLWRSRLPAEALQHLKSVLGDKSLRSRIKETSENGEDGGFAWLKATGYTSMRITSSIDYPQYVGKYLSEMAEELNMDAFDLICHLITNAEARVFITLGAIKEKDVQNLLVQPWNMVASDGNYTVESEGSRGHPRSTGTFPRVLGHYVRELNLMPLEEAIRKMTSLPADVSRLSDRGRIQDGLPADLVIFNAETIIDNSTFEKPNRYSSGVIHVFVNGVPVLLDEEMTGEAPGIFLKRQ